MKSARLIKVPAGVYEQAKRRQRDLLAAGVTRPLWELIQEAYEPPKKPGFGGFRL